jgi:hypothetical protein
MEIRNQLDLPRSHFLLRFMSIPKLIDFLERGSFYLSRIDKFGDKTEGISHQQLIVRQFAGNLLIPPQTKELTVEQRQERYFALCWFSGKRESIAMWDLYAPNGGVALKVNPSFLGKLESQTDFDFTKHSDWIRHVYIDNITYLDFLSYESAIKKTGKVPGLLKDISFEHEKEIRILVKTQSEIKSAERNRKFPATNPMYLKTSNIKCDEITILLNPRSPKWQKDVIRSLVKRYKWDNLKCKDSELNVIVQTSHNE